ncbi:MAG: SIR2 family protein [bacterium]|nr:SIR2 family protein [bacterium]
MTSSTERKRALLIGNGINQLDQEQSVSWGDLLHRLKNRFGIQVDLNNPFKPFPLGFEEMLHRKRSNVEFLRELKNLKRAIRRNIEEQLSGKDGFNEYHQKVMRQGYTDILTTNYDYALQKSVMPDFLEQKKKLALNKQESKFSLKRAYTLPEANCRVWHIHGELSDSRNLKDTERYYHEESIMIGYEHYASYLEKIQDNYKGKPGSRNPKNQGLLTRVKNGTTGRFWTDILFTHNVDIVGQGLDFSENHLWWLLNQRANLIRQQTEDSSFQIDNEIRFYFPVLPKAEITDKDDLEEIIKQRNAVDKARGIGEVLEAFMVVPKPIVCESYVGFYEKVMG